MSKSIDDRIDHKQDRVDDLKDKEGAANHSLKVLENVHPPKQAKDELVDLRKELRDVAHSAETDIHKLHQEIADLRSKKDKVDSGAKAAMAFMHKYAGTTESPYGSNKGPFPISESQEFIVGYDGVYWCGCIAGYAVIKIGGASITYPSRLAYGPSIIADAHTGANGLRAVSFADAQLGDILVYWGGEHIGLFDHRISATVAETVEGNTSSSTGSQSNGGGIYVKQRTTADISVIARPTYPK